MFVRIHDRNARTTYLAHSAEDCRGVDRHAYELACATGDVVTMGKVIAEPVQVVAQAGAPVHTLRSPCGLHTMHVVASTVEGMVLVQWHSIDQGTAETGPSSRTWEEPMNVRDARIAWRECQRDLHWRHAA